MSIAVSFTKHNSLEKEDWNELMPWVAEVLPKPEGNNEQRLTGSVGNCP